MLPLHPASRWCSRSCLELSLSPEPLRLTSVPPWDSEMFHQLHRVERRFKPGWVSRAYAVSSLSVCLPRKAGEAGDQGWLRRGHSTFSEASLRCPLPAGLQTHSPERAAGPGMQVAQGEVGCFSWRLSTSPVLGDFPTLMSFTAPVPGWRIPEVPGVGRAGPQERLGIAGRPE